MCNCKSQEYFTSSILKIVQVLFELILKIVHVSLILHTVVTFATILKIVKVLFELILKTVHVSIILHSVVAIDTDRITNFEKRKCETASLRSILHLQF